MIRIPEPHVKSASNSDKNNPSSQRAQTKPAHWNVSPVTAGACPLCRTDQRTASNKSTAGKFRWYRATEKHEMELFNRRGRLNKDNFVKICISCTNKKKDQEVLITLVGFFSMFVV